MPDVRAPLTEEVLRETKDDLLSAVQDQRRAIGVPVPDAKTAEEFIAPILRQTEVQHERERDRDLVRPAPEVKRRDPAWYAEPEHSPKMSEVPGTKGTFISEDIGQVQWQPQTGAVILDAKAKAAVAKMTPKESPHNRAVRLRIRALMKLPAWKARLVKAFTANIPKMEMLKIVSRIYWDSVRAFGDPEKPREPRIIVGGK